MKLTIKLRGGASSIAVLLGVGMIAPVAGVADASPQSRSPAGAEECLPGSDQYYTDQSQLLVVPAPGVTANDTACPDAWYVAVQPLDTPEHGSLTLHPDGGFEYSPDAGYTGPDKFVYRWFTEEDVWARSSTARISVLGVCDTIAVADAYETDQDQTLFVRSDTAPKANDSHCGHGYRQLSDPEHGSVLWRVDSSFDYTPDPGFAGVDMFTYELYRLDGTESDTATVTITVAAAPPPPPPCEPFATEDSYFTDVGDTLVSPYSVKSNDAECLADQDVEVVDEPDNGTLTFGPDGNFEYQPAAEFNGIDFFTYGYIGTDVSALVHIDVLCARVAEYDAYETAQGEVLDAGPPGVKGNDTPCGFESVAIESQPTNGTLTADADGSFQYTPNADFSGDDSFTYYLFHPEDHEQSNTATATITVAPASCTPVANDDVYEVPQDGDFGADPPGVLANDETCGYGAELLSQPGHGTLTLNADGSFQYTPNRGYVGPDLFEYYISVAPSGFARSAFGSSRGEAAWSAPDGSPSDIRIGAVTINVVEAAPGGTDPSCDAVAVDDAYETPQEVPLSVAEPGVLANDTTCEGGVYDFPNLEIEPSHGTLVFNEAFGTIEYTPDAGFTGVDTFEYFLISDDEDDTNNRATVTINVTEVPEGETPATTDPATPTTAPPEGAASGQLPATGNELTLAIAAIAVATLSLGAAVVLALGGPGRRRRRQA